MLRSVDILRESDERWTWRWRDTESIYRTYMSGFWRTTCYVRVHFGIWYEIEREAFAPFHHKSNHWHQHTHIWRIWIFKVISLFLSRIVFFVSSLNIVSKIFTIYPIEILYLLYWWFSWIILSVVFIYFRFGSVLLSFVIQNMCMHPMPFVIIFRNTHTFIAKRTNRPKMWTQYVLVISALKIFYRQFNDFIYPIRMRRPTFRNKFHWIAKSVLFEFLCILGA